MGKTVMTREKEKASVKVDCDKNKRYKMWIRHVGIDVTDIRG